MSGKDGQSPPARLASKRGCARLNGATIEVPMRHRIDDAHIDVYLREIRETPLLTAEEERELARRIRVGDKGAREHMVRANLRLVVAVAKEFLNRGLPFMDLIAEGNLGLLKAVERFDPDEGARFSTYGTWWIKQAIRRALVNSSKTVRVPSYMVEYITRFKQKSMELAKAGDGTPPDIKVVADALGFTDDQLDMLRRAMNSNTQSTDAVSGDGDTTLSEQLPDEKSMNPAEEVITRSEIAKLSALLTAIDPRESEILRMRYGIGVEQPMTLSEIGEKIGLTRERVRQIENEALRRLHTIMTRGSKPHGYEDW
jgi:RNA polymerase primary sigma factor